MNAPLKLAVAGLLLAACGVVAAQTAASTSASALASAPAPAPAPASTSASAPLLGDYEALQRKSIFAKDRVVRRNRSGFSGFNTAASRPVRLPVFVGVVEEDDGPVAFLEDQETGRLLQFRVGATLPNAAGTLRAITLDSIEVGSGTEESTRQIVVGQNILGVTPEPRVAAAAPVASAAGASTAPATTSSTAPATTEGVAGAETAPAAPSAVDDIAARMKRRRAQSLGN